MGRVRNFNKKLSEEQSEKLMQFIKEWRGAIHKHCFLQCEPPRLTLQDLWSDTVERLINFYALGHTVDKFGEEGFIKRLVAQSKMAWCRKQKQVFNVEFSDREYDDDKQNSMITPIQEEDNPFDSDYHTLLQYKEVIQKMKNNGLKDEQINLFIKRVVYKYSFDDLAEEKGVTDVAVRYQFLTVKKKIEKIFHTTISDKKRRYFCLETKETFDTLYEIQEKYNISQTSVLISARSDGLKAGGKIDNKYVHWKYV